MRSKFTTAAVMLVAVLAMSAVAASVASAAAPEFKPSTKQAFTGTSGALTVKNSVGEGYTCAKGTSSGEVTGASAVGKLVLTFTECIGKKSSSETGCYVKSVGAKNKGEIVTDALTGTLGEVNTSEAASGVGLLLEPESGGALAMIEKATCMTENAVEGSVAAEVTPIKTSGKAIKLILSGQGGQGKIKNIVVSGKKVKPSLIYGLESISWETTESLEFKSNALEVT